MGPEGRGRKRAGEEGEEGHTHRDTERGRRERVGGSSTWRNVLGVVKHEVQ